MTPGQRRCQPFSCAENPASQKCHPTVAKLKRAEPNSDRDRRIGRDGRRLVLKRLSIAASMAALALAGCGQDGSGGAGQSGGARDQIRIVGSSTVYPFATAVAEQFVRNNPGLKA